MESKSSIYSLSSKKGGSKRDSTKSDSCCYHLRRKRKKSLSDSFVSDISDGVLEEMESQKEQTIEIPSSNNTEPNMKNIKTMAINGNLVYVTKKNQIELKGLWSSNNEPIFNSEKKIEYLHKQTNKIIFPIAKKDIQMDEMLQIPNIPPLINENPPIVEDYFMLNINMSNLYSLLLIPNRELFKHILFYLGGKYTGYFRNQSIVKVDEVVINYNYDEKYQQILVNGSGEDDIGKYSISGNAELFTSPTLMISKNINENCNNNINLGELNINKYYFFYNLDCI